MSSENSVQTPVAVPTLSQPSGYFDQSTSYPSIDHQSTGTSPGIQHENLRVTSAPHSAGSLKAVPGRTISSDSLRRALSQRSSRGQLRDRRSSHSKSASSSSLSRRSLNSEHPTYPDQSFASLQNQFVRPAPPLRSRSSHPAQNLLYNEMKRDRSPFHNGIWTADNTPQSSPGPSTANDALSVPDSLHYLQQPKETHVAEVDHDMYTGNKLINNYEVIQELGRGEHGKVKLGRLIGDANNQYYVAIKIVSRFSKVRRLGRLGAPQDKTKREVAILKKARHPHVVSLLEVIDDPSKNKVYLVLEYVDNGEIKWRKQGVREIVNVALRRYEEEKAGKPFQLNDKDIFAVEIARKRLEAHEKIEKMKAGAAPQWSLEHGGEDDNLSDISPSVSRARESENISRAGSHDDHVDDLAGTMYGSYHDVQHRKFSIALSAVSHISSEVNFRDEQDEYVPALTLDEARRAFRDTLLGLEFLHYLGIIHRDIKPTNLLVTSSGRVKISDFGVSYLGRPTSDEDPENKLTEKDVSALDDERELARTVGTPAFWAPELCHEDPAIFADGKVPKITGAIDVWALGITLFCMIYARLPFYATKEVGLHEAVCHEEVFIPMHRLVPVDATKDKPTLEIPVPINSNKRLDFELKFEEVPDSVRDLIQKLLIKDPAKRMTIVEAKTHPWVIEGVENMAAWFEGPGAKKDEKARILDPDEKEVSYAVVSRNMISRVVNTARSVLAGIGRSNVRKRASSNTMSTSHSSDSISTAGGSNLSPTGKTAKEVRRQSLKPDDIVGTLKAPREQEHPLAQSQTASPDILDNESYFGEMEIRPTGPDRAVSGVSAADSLRTIRPVNRPQIPDIQSELEQITEPSIRSRVENIWGDTAKGLNRLTSRDRWSTRSLSSSRAASENGDIQVSQSPSVSTSYARDNIQIPDVLPTQMPAECGEEERRSADAAFHQAQEINQRRFIQEAREAEAASRVPERQESSDSCPPSPDDITYLQKQKGLDAGPSASTIASSVDDTANSSVSQSMSTPSFEMPSNASSPPAEGFLSAKILRINLNNRNIALRRARKELKYQRKGEEKDYEKWLHAANRITSKTVKDERKARREDWMLGPLAPDRDTGKTKGQFGAVDPIYVQRAELPKYLVGGPAVAEESNGEWKRLSKEELWEGEGNQGNIVVGDRVCVVNGPDNVKGQIGTVTEVSLEKGEVTVAEVNMADVSLPAYVNPEQAAGRKFNSVEIPIPIDDVRLVWKMNTLNGEQDVIVRHLRGGAPHTQPAYGSNTPWHTRYVGGTEQQIPWPEPETLEFKTEASDTPRAGVEKDTFEYEISIFSPPLPEGVEHELVPKYSRDRRTHDQEYMRRKIIEDARSKWYEQRRLTTPTQEVRQKQRAQKQGQAIAEADVWDVFGPLNDESVDQWLEDSATERKGFDTGPGFNEDCAHLCGVGAEEEMDNRCYHDTDTSTRSVGEDQVGRAAEKPDAIIEAEKGPLGEVEYVNVLQNAQHFRSVATASEDNEESKKSKLEDDRFECEKCGSVNVYDEKGEIVDLVPDDTEPPRQYAAPTVFQKNDIFCSICLKNQHLYTTALSQFLPDPDDPNYSQLEAAM
ncbi:hypothetical protein DV737_g4736, partial [Chaetothyriales sp. CBS 132003]